MITLAGMDEGYCGFAKATHLIDGPALLEKVINGDDRIGATLADQHGGILCHAHADQICICHVLAVGWPNAASIVGGALGFWEIDRSCHVRSIAIPSASACLLQLSGGYNVAYISTFVNAEVAFMSTTRCA
jgi:hypothetical protein